MSSRFYRNFILALGSVLLATSPAIAQNQFPLSNPNIRLTINRQAGTCPANVGLWAMLLPHEGGANHIVVADTRALGNVTKLTSANRTQVVYETQLEPKYASCVGQARSPELSMYRVEFRDKKAFFRVNPGPGNREIRSHQIVTGRPTIFWEAWE